MENQNIGEHPVETVTNVLSNSHTNVEKPLRKIIINNFIGGIVWSLGAWVGTTVIIAILVYFLAHINFIPIIGDFVAKVMKYVANANSPFHF